MVLEDDIVLKSLKSFKEIFSYLSKILNDRYVFVIDEFPMLAKKTEDIAIEFQWITDHAMGKQKIILMGSQMLFMKKQISSSEQPLYGRFDEIRSLSDSDEDTMTVYACTGGVAQYVMLILRYETLTDAMKDLFFNKDGRLFSESDNLLMMELKEPAIYKRILSAIGPSGKTTGQIAAKCNMEQRSLTSYLSKLIDLDIINVSEPMMAGKRTAKRYEISDLLFRFANSLIEPNISYITLVGSQAMNVILDERYQEYLGVVYEELIRRQLLLDGINEQLPFVPVNVGNWYGNICQNGNWLESEVDVIASDNDNVIIGECKYRTKKIGFSVLEKLKQKAAFIPVGKRGLPMILCHIRMIR